MILDMGITLAMVMAADMAAGLAPMTVGLEDVHTVDRAPQHSQVPGQHQVCVICCVMY